jgi:hypothetical protein
MRALADDRPPLPAALVGQRSRFEAQRQRSLVRSVTLLDGSLLPAPISGWPDLEGMRGCRDMGVCLEVIRMGGRRGIRRRRGLGGCREVIRMGRRGIRGRRVVPGTKLSTVSLTRRFRMAKWCLRKGDMMVFGRPMGGAGR